MVVKVDETYSRKILTEMCKKIEIVQKIHALFFEFSGTQLTIKSM